MVKQAITCFVGLKFLSFSGLEHVMGCTMIVFFFLSLPVSAADSLLVVAWWYFVSKWNGLNFLFMSDSGLQHFFDIQTYCVFSGCAHFCLMNFNSPVWCLVFFFVFVLFLIFIRSQQTIRNNTWTKGWKLLIRLILLYYLHTNGLIFDPLKQHRLWKNALFPRDFSWQCRCIFFHVLL